MLRILTSLVALLLLVACQQDRDDGAQSPSGTPESADATVQLSGKEAYDLTCAGCHEQGVDGAPKTGDREAWAGRSWLWEAVLFEHAKEGYMDMPARGGDESLHDAPVEKAAEYMLTRTFPDVNPAD